MRNRALPWAEIQKPKYVVPNMECPVDCKLVQSPPTTQHRLLILSRCHHSLGRSVLSDRREAHLCTLLNTSMYEAGKWMCYMAKYMCIQIIEWRNQDEKIRAQMKCEACEVQLVGNHVLGVSVRRERGGQKEGPSVSGA